MQRIVRSEGNAFTSLLTRSKSLGKYLQIKSKQGVFLELGGKCLSMFLCSSKQLEHYYTLDYHIITISSGDPECIWLKLMHPG